jgi:hypothetical protein
VTSPGHDHSSFKQGAIEEFAQKLAGLRAASFGSRPWQEVERIGVGGGCPGLIGE